VNLKEFKEVIEILKLEYPNWEAPAKEFQNSYIRTPYTILLSAILSAQTKDTITIQAIKRLTNLATTPQEMIKLSTKEIEEAIYPVGFYKKKAKTILEVSKSLIDNFDAKVPNSLKDLTSIKGVGVKSAKIVLENGFNQDVVAVDTHLHRVLNLIGFLDTKDIKSSDLALEKSLPSEYKRGLNRVIVSFGQTICKVKAPKCDICPIKFYCKSYKEA